jgi:hypothetical protein
MNLEKQKQKHVTRAKGPQVQSQFSFGCHDCIGYLGLGERIASMNINISVGSLQN